MIYRPITALSTKTRGVWAERGGGGARGHLCFVLIARAACLLALFVFSPPTTPIRLLRNLVIPNGLAAPQATAKLSLTHIAIGCQDNMQLP
jgi:hypothetical protein